MNLLIIEDEIDLLESIKEFLLSEAFTVETATTFQAAEEKIDLYDYDCIIVDISLPGGSGLDLIRKLKNRDKDTGVIIISAKNSLGDKLTGLDIGADDYLTKPFHLSELNARVKSIIRRRGLKGTNVKKFNELTLNFDTRRLFVNDKEVVLTRKEYDLLLYFIMNEDKVLSKENIAEHLWGDNMSIAADSFDFIYNHIKNMRKKLIENGSKDYIKTVYGIGYKFSE
ncbi:DNA-binding response OmpR family regulator [Parabacteroides sp. PF5-5]|uniref:response regulator transcription factor n=1 Tax=unclassified Parabacteroides TaxID=2649774 RepID=UPI0024750670|nr:MULTISPECIES: response regulator transcription factor [unclassified Parabacteroides]MDH6304928.1 DNA-binding response OmpR family regulator [Parabacteroides sp. PH5-39]MDH6315986.1 DNA-binding response OmpR family regulator [Parabacteroides sp. PF5-13]MDH6319643.1 DNA-binding response OmpR family regulator [Parabacteroides sp. PH5-13]MDH6323374.1 DNA-binding response OmpR family regulator [Parabacteroides sp. PH5-8]MDH6327117.1 DNA-binding response OmpR family regulator [Parabacteroides sp.